MIVGICGFGYTGSGAVRDYLKEFSDVSVGKDVELSFLYDPDGILNLENNIVINPIRYYSSDAAIKRFIKYMFSYDLCKYMKRGLPKEKFIKWTQKYINNIISVRYKGFWHFDKRQAGFFEYQFKYFFGWKFLRLFDRFHIDNSNFYPNETMYLPVDPETFYRETVVYVSGLVKMMNPKREGILVLDQPFPTNEPRRCFKFYNEPCKAIIVNKDPRDLYCFVKKYGGTYSRFMPSRDVNQFIAYYKHQMSLFKHEENSENIADNDVLIMNFEDLIYEYSNTTKIIDNFLGISEHKDKKKFFNPDISIGNTQIFRKCPEFSLDIEKIEKELGKYLYPFDAAKSNAAAVPFL